MSAAPKSPGSPSPSSGDGTVARFFKNLFLREAQITAADPLTEHFHLLTLQGEALKNLDWTPGDKIQISLGPGFTMRTYTPMNWDPALGQTRFLVHASGDTPGSHWARQARRGDAVQFMGPRGSLDLSALPSSAMLFGDETCFGLAAALRNTAQGKTARCVFEVNHPAESTIALAGIGITDAILISRASDESHLPAVHTELQQTANQATRFVLSGKAASLRSIRKTLTAAGIHPSQMKTKAYWAPGKIGPD